MFFRSLRRTCSSLSRLPALTQERYQIKRGSYAEVTGQHLQFFRDLLGENRLITDPVECEGYNIDWIRNVRGASTCVLKPKTTEEVSKILSFCNENSLAVCPQGGNTGLVAGSVPVFDEIVLSLSLMNKVLKTDGTSGALLCEAGCVLEQLDEHLANYNLMMPLDLGAKGSCQIGGNVSTNAGGLRLLRYGNLQGSVLGLEVVLASGEVLDLLSTLRKDNTGYHLKHLFIGSEGSLGVVTKVAIQCPVKPKAINVAFLGLESFDKVLETFKLAKGSLGEVLSSCEVIDAASLDIATKNLQMRSPLPDYPFYMLIETQGSHNEHDEAKLNAFFEDALNKNIILDGTTTNEPTKIKNIWDLRERISEGLLHDGYIFKYDLSLPTESFYALVPIMREKLQKHAIRVSGYGHLGDGNVHLNISVKEFTPEVLAMIEPFIYEFTAKLKGSVSAEHGIGFKKPKYLKYSKSQSAIALMQNLKTMMDPKLILNPYKVVPL